jgi:hypothetical protein
MQRTPGRPDIGTPKEYLYQWGHGAPYFDHLRCTADCTAGLHWASGPLDEARATLVFGDLSQRTGGILMLDASGRCDERAGREPWLWWEDVIGGVVRRERASLRQVFLLLGYIILISCHQSLVRVDELFTFSNRPRVGVVFQFGS